MRQPTYAFLAITSIVAAGVVGGACSNEVLFAPDGTTSSSATGSSGGSGGAPPLPGVTGPATSTNVSTGVVSTSAGPMTSSAFSSVATTTTGGGTSPCDLACSHAASCGADLCQKFGVDCTSVSTQFECPLKCIASASCSDIDKLAMQQFNTPLGACILGCQGGGSGPTSASSSVASTSVGSTSVGQVGSSSSVSTGSGGMFQCQQCAFQSCGSTLQACFADTKMGGCAQWGQCIQSCQGSPSCYSDCDAQFPNAAAEYKPIYGCLCKSCDAQCGASIDPCSHQ